MKLVSFENFQITDNSPIYQQIILFIKRKIVSGEIKDGEELPSRRVLSALLGVNPNTIQKSYRILEDEGMIESRSGAKSVFVIDKDKTARIKDELLTEDALGVIGKLKEMGIKKEEAHQLIDKHWN